MSFKESIEFQHGDEQMYIHHQQDVEPILKECKIRRELNSQGKMQDFVHFGKIPWVVATEIKTRYGIDIMKADSDALKRFMQIIQRDYPHLMASEGCFA